MKKTLYFIIPLLVLAFFIAGCGNETPTGDVVKDTEESTIEGKECQKNNDCGEREILGESFCLGNQEYQRYTYYRCAYGTKTCESYEKDERIGKC